MGQDHHLIMIVVGVNYRIIKQNLLIFSAQKKQFWVTDQKRAHTEQDSQGSTEIHWFLSHPLMVSHPSAPPSTQFSCQTCRQGHASSLLMGQNCCNYVHKHFPSPRGGQLLFWRATARADLTLKLPTFSWGRWGLVCLKTSGLVTAAAHTDPAVPTSELTENHPVFVSLHAHGVM